MTNPLAAFSVDELRQRKSEKWQHYGPDVLPLWVAEMDSTIAEPVTEVLAQALATADTGYASGNDYGQAFSEYAAAEWNWDLNPHDTFPVIDVMRGIAEVIRQFSDSDGSVIITPPVYYPFAKVVQGTGRHLINAPLTTLGRLQESTLVEALDHARARGKSIMILLSNPHNPTGVAHTKAELVMVARLAREYGARIVSDEIHGPLMMPGFSFIPLLSVPGAENAIVVTSASKSFNLAGLKAALVVGGSESAAEIRKVSENFIGASHWGMLAHSAAYRSGQPWLDQVIVNIQSNSELLTGLLSQHMRGALYRPVQATYLAWVDFSPLGLGDDPAKLFLDKGKVAFSSGPTFGPGGEGFIRVNLATSPAILTEAIERAASSLT